MSDPARLSAYAAIFALVFTLCQAFVQGLVKYIEAKYAKPTPPASDQSARCKFEHQKIGDMINRQNEHISELLRQNGEQIKALTNANHTAELRHQIYISKMDQILSHLPSQR